MNYWLGTGSKARAWRKFLNLNVLDSQTARGEQADPNALRLILQRFKQNHASLQHPIFKEVRKAIGEQIAQIERAQSAEFANLQFAVHQSVGKFQKPGAQQLEQSRDLARYELEVLKKSYRRYVKLGTRCNVFYKLKLDDTIEFLSKLEIEMPPEVSVGKMNSMIADERKRLEEVTDKIDALPIESPEEDTEESPEDLDIEVLPPGPDNDEKEDLKTLEARKKAIENRIRELRKKGREIAKKDRPRQIRRRDAGLELRRKIQPRFRELARERTDPAFHAAKQAIDRFADAYIFGTEDNIQQEFLDQVTELASLIPDLDDPNAQMSHAKIGDILHWLESRQQLNDLCVAIRRRYSSPNAYVSISSRMIQGLTSQSRSQQDKIAEDFLGRFARGLSFTTTNVNLVPVNNPDQVHVSILLDGTASTSTYIRERGFRVDSSASGYLSARRDLFGNLNGLFATKATADATMSTQFGGINSSCGLVQRFAKKNFQKEQGRANEESTRRVRQRLKDTFVSETSGVIDNAVDQVESFSERAREFATLLPQIYFRSFSEKVEAVAKKDTRFAIGSTVQPTFQTAGTDVQVKIHESMIGNYLDLIFAGRSFTKSDFEKELKELDLAGKFPAGSGDGDEVADFKITFPKVRPIQVLFADNHLGVRITGSRFEQGENAIKTNVTIDLKAKVVSRNGKLFLVLDGAPEIDFAEGQEPDAESIAFVKILEDRLAEAVEKSGEQKIELPQNLIPPISNPESSELLDSLQLGLLEFRDGWIYLGWNWKGGVVNTPAVWNEVVVEEINPLYLDGVESGQQPNDNEASVLVIDLEPEPDTNETQPGLEN